eukprot:scaffold267850_cov21-Tisochrysis_lutea.AAC.1
MPRSSAVSGAAAPLQQPLVVLLHSSSSRAIVCDATQYATPCDECVLAALALSVSNSKMCSPPLGRHEHIAYGRICLRPVEWGGMRQL